jgi:hypothetical protein
VAQPLAALQAGGLILLQLLDLLDPDAELAQMQCHRFPFNSRTADKNT